MPAPPAWTLATDMPGGVVSENVEQVVVDDLQSFALCSFPPVGMSAASFCTCSVVDECLQGRLAMSYEGHCVPCRPCPLTPYHEGDQTQDRRTGDTLHSAESSQPGRLRFILFVSNNSLLGLKICSTRGKRCLVLVT